MRRPCAPTAMIAYWCSPEPSSLTTVGAAGVGIVACLHRASPELQDFGGRRQAAPAVAASPDGHHALADESVGQRLAVTRPERLEAEPAGVRQPVPPLTRHFAQLQPLALDDGHLPPGAVEPHVPRDVPGRPAQAAVALEGMEPVVERVVDLPLDESAADPEAAGPVTERPRVEASRDLVGLVPLLPGQTGVRDDQLLPHDQPFDIEYLRGFGPGIHQPVGGGDRKRDGDEAVFHRGDSVMAWAGHHPGRGAILPRATDRSLLAE